ncbi:enoyl-CoA hydratase/isomerase family protein [Actinomycetospora sp. OC33-EN08]|uniref:Enoyl-CoA hydratase/isomerase family protein n=1 Tax=Actinomycetospora aurantiaca TaxID=3129233 RepID=A0ABU8MT60_9PSEU
MEVSSAGGVATVSVPGFAPLSRFDADFAWELRDTVVALADDDLVKVVLLRATGADFAPWPDGPVSAASPPSPRWRRVFAGANGLYQSLCFAKKAVVTEVAGSCVGAGAMLVLCSHLTVAADDALFGSPFAVLPESNFVLAALTMRLNRAKAWAVTDEPLGAVRAEEAGLVNDVVSRAALPEAAARLAVDMAAMPLDGMVMTTMLRQAVLDAHGVGREFDLAPHYASGRRAVEG